MMRKRFRFLGVLVLVFALALPCRSAFALDIFPNGSYWGGVTESGTYGSIVRASNKYDAAVYAIGEDPNTLSDEVKAKLSDSNYGGNFYSYASEFYNVTGFDSIPGFVPTYVVGSFTALAFTWERVFAAETATSLRDAAIVDYRRVLAGEDLGGGGSVGNVTSATEYVLDSCDLYIAGNNGQQYVCSRATIDSDGNVVVGSGTVNYSAWLNSSVYKSTLRLYLSTSWQNLVNQLISDGKQVYVSVITYTNGFAVVYVMACDSYYLVRNADEYGVIRNRYVVTNGVSYLVRSQTLYADGVGPFLVLGDVVPSPSNFGKSTDSPVYFSPGRLVSAPPSGTWPEPETPVTPDPPEVPEPTAPTETPDPDPTAPTVVWPTAPIVVNPPEVTVEVTPSGIDYTELLTLINDNLNSIDAYTQAINSCLNSLRADIVVGFDDVVTSLRNVYQYLTHLNDMLEVHCKHIRDSIDQNVYELELYLKSLFEWLPRQLDYDAQFTYDDSAVTTLLYRILNKIPGGSTATPPTYMPNPQADEPGFFDWLLDLWHRFLIDLVSVLPDELGGLVDAFSQLTHYFPFSIPWDLFALLALFEHEPVTPVFDVPLGFGGGENDVVLVRVDLSVWDSVMAFIRPVFVVGFCIKLALITKDLLSNFDINKGGV